MSRRFLLTFDSACDVEESLWILLAHIPGVQPALLVDGFCGFIFHAEVAHEHMTSAHTDLNTREK